MKSNFFKDLLNPTSLVSSKRFAGLFLIVIFGLTAIASVFTDINSNAVDLCKNAGYMGSILLGANAVEKVVEKLNITKKTKTDEKA